MKKLSCFTVVSTVGIIVGVPRIGHKPTNRFIAKTMILMWILVISLALVEQGLAGNTNQGVPIVKVMTQNVFIGADLDIILDEPNQAGVIKFLQAVQNTDFPERAEALADVIQRQKPDLIGLQEVALFEPILSTFIAFPHLDFKEILLEALSARNLYYEAARIRDNTSVTVTLDMNNDNMPDEVISFTDRDVILVQKKVTVGDTYAFTFETLREGTPIGSIKRGYAAIDATVRGKTYRFVNTHLENRFENGESDETIQDAQVKELIEHLDYEEFPIILVGDFNSGPSKEQPVPIPGSPYDQLVEAGYIDAWTERNGPRPHSIDPGYTCCQDKDLLNPLSELDKRIDLIWIRHDGLPLGVNEALAQTTLVGDNPKEKTYSGLWPSDHAGVAAKMNIPSNGCGPMASGFKKAQRGFVGLKW